MKNLTLSILIFILASCGTSKNISVLEYSTPLPENTNVVIIGVGQKVPDGAKLLGHVKIGDSGLSTKCNYETVIKDAQHQCRIMGANLFQITKHKEPSLGSSCHRIEGDAYLVKN